MINTKDEQNDVPAKVSISGKTPVDAKISFDLENGSMNFLYNSDKVEINALDISPLFTSKERLSKKKYTEFYDKLNTKNAEGGWGAVAKKFATKDSATANHTLLEYMGGEEGKEEVQYLDIEVKKEESKRLHELLWKIISKDYTADSFDMIKDIKIMGDDYPYSVALQIGSNKETTEDL